jgi:GMP reductase
MTILLPEPELDYSDVLFQPKRNELKSRSEVDLVCELKFRSGGTFSGVPIIAANMDNVGTMAMARSLRPHGLSVALHKHYDPNKLREFFEAQGQSNIWYSIGMVERDVEKLDQLIASGVSIERLCIDVANGYSQHFVDFVKRMRDTHPTITIMAGNVVTGDMTQELIFAGADIVKVGIGPGSVCTTRKQTGVGRPQLSAVLDCAQAAKALNAYICADGGCTVPGDVAKAFGAGAGFVMLGGMLAGHTESEASIIKKDGKEFLEFYGMSSAEAMKKHAGGVAEYRSSEGKKVEIPYRGDVSATVLDILGGIRSTCTYIGSKRLQEMPSHTTFYRVNRQINNVFGPVA